MKHKKNQNSNKKHKLLMQSILLCICFCLFAASFSGCSVFGNKFTVFYDIRYDPINLDPQTASDEASLIVISNIFEGLYSLSETGQAIPALAKESSQSGSVYTFTLRDDVFWENEKKVTAYDFEFGFNRLIIPETNSPGAEQFFCIKNAEAVHKGEANPEMLGVKALSESILEITLEQPRDDFLYLLTATYAMPCNQEFFKSTKGKYGLDPDKILANGPFNLYSWKHDSALKLNKSKTYYDSKSVMPQGVNLYVKPAEETLARLSDETIHAGLVPRKSIEQFEKKGYNIQPIENTTWGIWFNCKSGITSNEKIRQGIAKNFERQSYNDALGEELFIAQAIVPHGILFYNELFREGISDEVAPKYNTGEASALIKEGLAELGKDSLVPLSMIINKEDFPEAASLFSYPSQILQREISLFINVEELTDSQYKSRLNSGDFDIAFGKAFNGGYSLSSIFTQLISTSDKNKFGYSNEAFDETVTKAIAATNTDEAKHYYADAEKILVETAAFIPMVYSTDYFVEAKKISGIDYNEQNGLINFKLAKKS